MVIKKLLKKIGVYIYNLVYILIYEYKCWRSNEILTKTFNKKILIKKFSLYFFNKILSR